MGFAIEDVDCPESVALPLPLSILFRGQALVQRLEKPNDTQMYVCALYHIMTGRLLFLIIIQIIVNTS